MAGTGPHIAATKAGPGGQLAPAAHTAVLLAVLIGVSLTTAHLRQGFAERHGRPALYLILIAWQGLLVLFVAWGLRLRQVRLRDIAGAQWRSFADALLDLGIAAVFWVGIVPVLGVVSSVLDLGANRDVTAYFLPRSGIEMLLWAALSMTAGSCEEIIFRGYLQRQLAAWAGHPWAGLTLSAAVFGLAHGYLGPARMVQMGVLGALFGALALWRRSLRPGILAHTWTNLFAGLVSPRLLRL